MARLAQADFSINQVSDYLSSNHNNDRVIQHFTHLFFDHAYQPKFEKYPVATLAQCVEFIWQQFSSRQPKESLLTLQPLPNQGRDSNAYLVALVNDDRPYIVDTLKTFLAKWQISPKLLIHPVLHVKRDPQGRVEEIFSQRQLPAASPSELKAESVILIYIERPFEEQELIAFQEQMQKALQRLFYTVDQQAKVESMLGNLQQSLRQNSSRYSEKSTEVAEAIRLLNWLRDGHFLFLGARYFKSENSQNVTNSLLLKQQPTDSAGLFVDEELASDPGIWPKLCADTGDGIGICKLDLKGLPLVSVVKTNWRSPIIRNSRLDTIELVDYSSEGDVQGFYQFIGLFTKEIFTTSAFEIPYLMDKAKRVFNHFGLDANWHDGKVLTSVIDSIPRDEMFYHGDAELIVICERVLKLLEDGNLAVFSRPDRMGLYLTVIVYLPRERYSYDLMKTFGGILARHYQGVIASAVSQVGDLPFARAIYVLNFNEKKTVSASPDLLEAELQKASLPWQELLLTHMSETLGEKAAQTLLADYAQAFSGVYQENFEAEQAYIDIQQMEELSTAHATSLSLLPTSELGVVEARVYHLGQALHLSRMLPILANLGFNVLSESTFKIEHAHKTVHIHQFQLQIESPTPWQQNKIFLQAAFREIWQGSAENDGFNQLIIRAGLTVRQVCLVRALAKYLMQVKFSYSLGYLETTLAAYPTLVTALVEYFEAKFQPKIQGQVTLLEKEQSITMLLQEVARSDHDKILRRFLNTLKAMVRTNYYQPNAEGLYKEYISFKFDCALLDELPHPHPLYEVFVYSPRVEAIHLRGGKVARGGLRWSDRFEDYRTEVLGLMKAQMVKNSVIVPSGSKGGFIVKRQSMFSDRQELMQEVIECYQTMIRGLLDLTDNLKDGKVVTPAHLIRHDGDDPYLVVAADKGTATFSDIANAISQEYNFWLDDAFASGGSAGYDHKKMAITSRGAWESVKRHFREQRIDINQPFTVAGVGDMSGDVFGNGMLRSDKVRLVAAFDHRHIFIDPTPSPETSYAERLRLFNLPRSSWADYNNAVLSKGGGIYSRLDKEIILSQEAQALLGLAAATISPDQLVRTILKMPVDLLWFGGIGTFIKSAHESNLEVGDLVNQSVRIDAKDIRAKVITEGANLGATQLARIEYALKYGAINTDAIDNSAGVDCSDHEVNIKILFGSVSQTLARPERDEILRSMTDEVGALVLQDNYRQTLILSVMQAQGVLGLSAYQNLIKSLEAQANLDRVLEYLPDEEAIERRRAKDQGLTRPELAVLLAYAKNTLGAILTNSETFGIDNYDNTLINYFPSDLQKQFRQDILSHPLKREIIITCLVNEMINRVGPTFVHEVENATGKTTSQVVTKYFQAVEILNLSDLWNQIDELDALQVPELQIKSYLMIVQALKSVVIKLLTADSQELHADVIKDVLINFRKVFAGDQLESLQHQERIYQEMQLPEEICRWLTKVPYLPAVIDIALSVKSFGEGKKVAELYFNTSSRLKFDWLSQYLQKLEAENAWQRAMQLGFLEEISQILKGITAQILAQPYSGDLESWCQVNGTYVKQSIESITQIRAQKRPDFGLLSYVIKQLNHTLPRA